MLDHPDIIRLERELRDAKKRLTQALRALPPETIPDMPLRHVPSGSTVRLSELFGTRDELLLVHNMGKRCPYCTLWADGFASMYRHLSDRCAFVLSTPDEPAVASAFASARGWTFPIVSFAGTDFARRLGFEGDTESTYGAYQPGVSAFARTPAGIVRTGTRRFGPGDDFCALWPMFDLLRDGENGWRPKIQA